MFLRRLCIKNYKSLRNVEFCPTNLSVLVGPNGAGKSNFASAVDFLSDVYAHGLEIAVARKGGYENIAFRRQRRSRSAIRFEVTLDMNGTELGRFWPISEERSIGGQEAIWRLRHEFSFNVQSQAIGAEFRVATENLEIRLFRLRKKGQRAQLRVASFARPLGEAPSAEILRSGLFYKGLRELLQREARLFREFAGIVGQQQLVFANPTRDFGPGRALVRLLGNCQVFQFAPGTSRAPGVPTPNPTLSVTGDQLPAVVAWLKEHHRARWNRVVESMREIVPGVRNIDVKYLQAKTLGLFFQEDGGKKSWAADDVSDGTIRTLAILVALVDPRNTALVMEELENSVHPWIIRTIVDRIRKASEQKSVVLTTHSPVVVDAFQPTETWVVYKKAGESIVKNILDVAPSIGTAWEAGEFALSEYLDSGLLPHAVPGGDL